MCSTSRHVAYTQLCAHRLFRPHPYTTKNVKNVPSPALPSVTPNLHLSTPQPPLRTLLQQLMAVVNQTNLQPTLLTPHHSRISEKMTCVVQSVEQQILQVYTITQANQQNPTTYPTISEAMLISGIRTFSPVAKSQL